MPKTRIRKRGGDFGMGMGMEQQLAEDQAVGEVAEAAVDDAGAVVGDIADVLGGKRRRTKHRKSSKKSSKKSSRKSSRKSRRSRRR
jgi:hypothetical protein